MITRVTVAGEAGSCMSTNERKGLELAGKIASFVVACIVVLHQMWRTQYGQDPNWMLMAFAMSILAPTVFQMIAGSRAPTAPSTPPAEPSSSSSSESSSSGG